MASDERLRRMIEEIERLRLKGVLKNGRRLLPHWKGNGLKLKLSC